MRACVRAYIGENDVDCMKHGSCPFARNSSGARTSPISGSSFAFFHPSLPLLYTYQGALAVDPLGTNHQAADVVLTDACGGLFAPIQTPQDLFFKMQTKNQTNFRSKKCGARS